MRVQERNEGRCREERLRGRVTGKKRHKEEGEGSEQIHGDKWEGMRCKEKRGRRRTKGKEEKVNQDE